MPYPILPRIVWVVAIITVWSDRTAQAQDSENALLRARDAFGERVGVEQVGLYNENQVRGFNLNDTASYRVDGLYFLREFQLPDTVLAGVSVKVGINAARLDYPSPSGVVEYRFKDPKPGTRQLSVNLGLRDYGTQFVEMAAAYAPPHGQWALAGGIQALPHVRYPNGTGGNNYGIGFVPQFRPADHVRIRTVFSGDRSTYDGDYSIASSIVALPPRINGQNLSPPWARVLRYSYNMGALADVEFSSRWSLAGSVFYSDTQRAPQDFSLVTLRPDRTADVTLQPTLNQHATALTGSAILKYHFDTTRTSHTFSVAARGRQSRDQRETLPALKVGVFDTTNLAYPAVRPATPGPISTVQSDVDQVIGSFGYGGNYFERLELRGGIHRTHYTKTVVAANGVISKRPDNTWFYNASAVFAAGNALTVFANTVKGVEESGIAPQNAVNRSEVLPPVVTKEYEVGTRWAVTPRLSLTVAGFDVTKLTNGLKPDGIFAIVGEANHRGVEVSLSGELIPGTSVVIGAMAMKPRLSGQLVSAGLVGRKPAAVSSTVGIASIDHRLSWAPGWSVDSRVSWQGPREVNVANTLEAKGFALLSAGGRYAFDWKGHSMLLRFAVSNLFTDRPFIVQPGSLVSQNPGTTGRISLRIGLVDD